VAVVELDIGAVDVDTVKIGMWVVAGTQYFAVVVACWDKRFVSAPFRL
jgi:hypothetical protein